MEFLPTADYWPEWTSLAYFIYGCLLFVLLLWLAYVLTKKDYFTKKSILQRTPPEIIPIAAFFGLLLIAIPVVVINLIAVGEKEDVAATNLKSNIMQKYDVKNVEYDFSPYQTLPTYTGEQRVVVETKDGKRVIFNLKQSEDTNEPTLRDLPVESGQTITETITVEDIQK